MKRIDRMPEAPPDFFTRRSGLILWMFLLTAPVLIYAAARAVGTNSNQLADWLPQHLDETRDLEQFGQWFGDGQFILLSWDGCLIDPTVDPQDTSKDDPRLARLAALLMSTDDAVPEELELNAPTNLQPAQTLASDLAKLPFSADDRARYFRNVITSRTLLQTLTSAPMNLPLDEAVKRITGSVLGAEGNACCIVQLRDFPPNELRRAIGFRKARLIDSPDSQGILFQAMQVCDISLDQAYLGGPPIDNLSINEEGQRTLLRLGLAAGALGLVLAWWSLRSLTLTAIVFSCGILSTCGATAAIWVTGCHADAIVLAMPSLIYVLTISGAIHLVNYYRDEVNEHGIPGAAQRSLRAGFKPAALCSFTTALGLLSLFASDLTPIRRFGIFSALGMVLMLVVLFLLLPAALQFFGRKRAFGFVRTSGAVDRSQDNSGSMETWAVRWAHWVIRHHRVVCVSGLLLMIALSCGLVRMRTSVDLLKLFDAKTRILADYRWLEANIGNLVPLEVLIRFDADAITTPQQEASDGKINTLQRAQIVSHIRNQMNAKFGLSGEQLISEPMSAVAFLPALPHGRRGTAAVIRNRITNERMEESRQALIDSGYLAVDEATGDEVWRISLRVAAFRGVDYGIFAERVKGVVEPLVQEASGNIRKRMNLAESATIVPVTAVHTGAIPIVYKAQRELLQSLIESTAWSFVTITPLLMFVTRGIASGCVAMLPNLLPVLAVFGSMGWLGISVDIGCMMTASIALGVAVDDTIHFLVWYQHRQKTSQSRDEAIEETFRSCCRPTLQASLVNGLGLSVFLLSTFVPTKQFGLLMLVILTCGAAAELILLPALLASPLGRLFDKGPSLPTLPKSQGPPAPKIKCIHVPMKRPLAEQHLIS